MDTTLIAYGDEIEELLKQSISSYVSYSKHLPGADYNGQFLACLDAMCRDSRFPNQRCDICTKAANGGLGSAMKLLVSARRARRLSGYNFSESRVRLATAADIGDVLDVVTLLHDATTAAAINAPSLSSDTIETFRSGKRRKAAA